MDEPTQVALNQLELELRTEDCVMEPGVLDTITRYIKAQGKPTEAIENLTSNYVGYAQMTNVVCGWLEALSQEDGAQSTRRAGVSPNDEAHFLREYIKEHFEPSRFTAVFSKEGKPPAWLEKLQLEPGGRQLIYELSAKHRGCLMLNYAIQKILYAGNEHEVASMGSSLAGYFGVFHRLMAGRLRAAAAAAQAQALPPLLAELQESCCQTEHTYVHAQQLLCELGRQPTGACFRRLSQDLEAAAAASHGAAVWRLQPLFCPPDATEDHLAAAQQVAGLLAAAGTRSVPPHAEVLALHRMYADEEPPPIEPLHHPRVLDILISTLFSGQTLAPETDAAYLALAALATAALELPVGDAQYGGGGDGGGEHQFVQLDLSDVAAAREALQSGRRVAQRAAAGTKLDAAQQAEAESVMESAAAAMGLLHMVRSAVRRPEYWRERYHMIAAPAFLALLSTMMTRQPQLHSQVLEIVAAALQAMGNSHPDAARGFLDIAVQILAGGAVEEVLSFVGARYARAADPSLVRYFVFGVLAAVAPPYSPHFAASILRLMLASGVRKARAQRESGAQADLLEEYASACTRVDFQPPLSLVESTFLQDLQS